MRRLTRANRRWPAFLLDRHGAALAISMLAIVVIGLLIGSAFLASNQEFRMARNGLDATREFVLAEQGLSRTVATWEPRRNLALAVNGDSSFAYDFGEAGAARVIVSRLGDDTYSIVSEGRSSRAPLVSRRRTGLLLRLQYSNPALTAALTVSASADVRANVRVDGSDNPPLGWNCSGHESHDASAIAGAPDAIVTIDGNADVRGSPPTQADSAVENGGVLARYSDDTWTALAKRADIVVDGERTPSPLGDVTSCTYGDNNWGEPHRGADAILGCVNFFPVVLARTTLRLSDGRGQGILLVDGDLIIGDNFEWVGLVIVRGAVVMAGTRSAVAGAIISRSARLGDGNVVARDGPTLQYSRCAVLQAVRGSAPIVPVVQRAWSELW